MPLFLLNQPRCLFAHIPKTAGNSIRNVVFEGDYAGPWFGDELPADWMSLFKFAFVRNPFDRVVSAWKMFSEGTVDDAWELPEGGALEMSLEEVLMLGLDDNARFGHPRYNQIKPDPLIRLKNHILPQTHSYHGLQHIEFIGRFERLPADFALVARTLALSIRELPHSNWTERTHYRDYFDDRTRRLAEELYADDLEQLKYEF
ncbi:MAG: sulfotransferase family 2 domain-containing protein [Pirellulaceae bacterium]